MKQSNQPYRRDILRHSLPTAMTWLILLWLSMLPPTACADEKSAPWWETETAMDKNGRLILTGKPWWDRAKGLNVGEHFLVKSKLSGGGQMLVRKSELTGGGQMNVPRGKKLDAVIWVIDDDGDMKPDATDGDKDSDCYVVDYDGDGKTDRMVDYMDNDGVMLDASCYSMSGSYSDDDPKHLDTYDGAGNSEIMVNRYDPQQKRWWPICECPFNWYDNDGDGETEITIRIAAVPRKPYPPKTVDGGNSFHVSRVFDPRLRNIGAVAIRYCVDISGSSSPKHRIHYDLGLNMTSSQVPYKFDGMNRENPWRRPPKTIVCIPHKALLKLAEDYPANQTGFSWFQEAGALLFTSRPANPSEGSRRGLDPRGAPRRRQQSMG